MTDTITVSFSVSDFQRLQSAGRLLAQATVEIDLGGVGVTLHGVQVVRLPNGRLQARAPRHRSHTGQWVPAITLPDELEVAIGIEVLAAFSEPCV